MEPEGSLLIEIKFITVFTGIHHWFLSWARKIQSIPSHPVSQRPIILLFFHPCQGLPSGLFPSGFPTKTLYGFLPLLSPLPLMHVTYPAHFIHLDLIILIIFGKGCELWDSSVCSFILHRQNIQLDVCSNAFALMWQKLPTSQCLTLQVGSNKAAKVYMNLSAPSALKMEDDGPLKCWWTYVGLMLLSVYQTIQHNISENCIML
jgi:hypothetical protein